MSFFEEFLKNIGIWKKFELVKRIFLMFFYVQELPYLVSLNEVTKHEKSKKSQEEGEGGEE